MNDLAAGVFCILVDSVTQFAIERSRRRAGASLRMTGMWVDALNELSV
jgi:hypothetical protein